MARSQAVVAVLGGCLTRDNFDARFNPDHEKRFACGLWQQSSLVSLMSTPIREAWEPVRETSEEQRCRIAAELDRSFLPEVAALQPDYLVVDFFADAYFGLGRLDTGEYVTHDRDLLRRTDLYRAWRDQDRLERLKLIRDAEVYVPAWQAAFDAFVRFARDRLPATALVLHRGRFTDSLALPGTRRPVSLREHRGTAKRIPVKRANRAWAELDDYAAARVDAVIDLTGRDHPTFPAHPRGPFYVHYAMDYYPAFLAQLEAIDDRLLRR
jgi:hypothetical protein